MCWQSRSGFASVSSPTASGVDETTATRLVDRLEAMGVAERRSEEGDRRATLVGLTAAGAEIVAEVAARRQRFFCEVLAALEPSEQARARPPDGQGCSGAPDEE